MKIHKNIHTSAHVGLVLPADTVNVVSCLIIHLLLTPTHIRGQFVNYNEDRLRMI